MVAIFHLSVFLLLIVVSIVYSNSIYIGTHILILYNARSDVLDVGYIFCWKFISNQISGNLLAQNVVLTCLLKNNHLKRDGYRISIKRSSFNIKARPVNLCGLMFLDACLYVLISPMRITFLLDLVIPV